MEGTEYIVFYKTSYMTARSVTISNLNFGAFSKSVMDDVFEKKYVTVENKDGYEFNLITNKIISVDIYTKEKWDKEQEELRNLPF